MAGREIGRRLEVNQKEKEFSMRQGKAEGRECREARAWKATPDVAVMAVEEQARRFYSEDRLDRAGEHYEKLTKMRPEVSDFEAMLGIIHRREGRMVRALQHLQRAAELDSTNRNALVNLGECLVMVGKVKAGADLLIAVFKMGYEKGKPAAEQDVFTKRAGAQLALLERVGQAGGIR